MEKTINSLFTWKGLREDIRQYVKTCRECQLCKIATNKYGKLPAKEAEPAIPWNRVNVDLIGPYTVGVKGNRKQTLELRAMTLIDPTTGWFEIAQIETPSAAEAERVMDDVWLSRYPRPAIIGFDNGGEFKQVFEQLCTNMAITPKISLKYNPQSNGMIERIHQVVGNMLRTFELEETELDSQRPFERFLAAVAYAIRATYHTTLEASPAELVFGRHMLLPVQFKADWEAIRHKRQEAINRNNARENSTRVDHTYKVGDFVSVTRPGIQRKLRRKRDGPHVVTKVHDNGTISIRQNGAVVERINIRRVTPYHEPEAEA